MTLAAEIALDISRCFLSGRGEFETTITIGGVSITAIVIDDFNSVDPRAPQVWIKASDVAAQSVGAVAVIGSNTYAVVGYQPDGQGGAVLQLQP